MCLNGSEFKAFNDWQSCGSCGTGGGGLKRKVEAERKVFREQQKHNYDSMKRA